MSVKGSLTTMDHAVKTASKPRPASTGPASRRPGPTTGQPAMAPRAAVHPLAARCSCGGSCPRCQAKASLRIGAPDDAFEREADAVADQVLRMPGSAAPVTPAAAGIQRKCGACARDDEPLPMRLKASPAPDSAHGEAAPSPARTESLLSSPGQALDAATRTFFDARFGYDFSAVRVHADAAAAKSARGINALAYTVGRDIVFGAGQFATGTHDGRRLLAHELTHVIQQAGGSPLQPGRTAPAPRPAQLQRQEDDGGDDLDFGEVAPSTSVAAPPPEFGTGIAESACPRVPTHLGDLPPDPPCPTAVSGFVVGSHFQFCIDSDTFIDQRQVDFLRGFARRQRADSIFNVHGFASTDGQAGYNLRLSCHRAKRAARELQNAGVPSQQIQIAARGATSSFGPTQAENRIVVVSAEAPAEQVTPDAGEPATSLRDAADRAISRILARDYRLAADAYVSRWTCGTIPSVAEMVRRTTVLVEGENNRAQIRRPGADPLQDPRLGHPNLTGLREIVLASEVFSEASAPVLCAAARIIDMAFHHFLAPRLGVGPNDERSPVHAAALFLVELAGFPPCVTPARVNPDNPSQVLIRAARWWRAQVLDPLDTVATRCPGQPLGGPIAPQQQLGRPAAPLTFSAATFEPRGSSATLRPRIDARRNLVRIAAPTGAFSFRATVQAAGDPSQFPRYQVGFVQTIVADATVAEYVSGHAIHLAVPTPMRDGPPQALAAPPWHMPPLVRQLDASGQATAEMSDSPSVEMPLTFTDLTLAGPGVPPAATVQAGNDLNRALVRTTFHSWVVARRDDAPLDRFSTHFIRGHETTFSMDLDMLDRSGDASEVSQVDPAPLTDSTPMQLAGPTPADMRPDLRLTHVSPPTARAEVPNAADAEEIRRQVRELADELAPLRIVLGLDGPIMVRVRFDPVSGRLRLDTPERPATVIQETGAPEDQVGVSETGRKELGRMFTIRLRKDLVAAPGVPDLGPGFPTALLALPSFAERRRRALAEPNPFSAAHGIGLLAHIRESQELARADAQLRTAPRVYDPTVFPLVEVNLAQESYCFDFSVSGLDISAVCIDPTMRTEGCVRPASDSNFTLRSDPTFLAQQLGGETFNSPVAVRVTTMPLRFNLFTPSESPGGSVFSHEMHHMIDSRNIVQAMKERMARRIRARLMQARTLAAANPQLKDSLLSRSAILEIVRQENQPFVDFFQREFLARGRALHARELQTGLPPYRTALPRDWTTFREPAFRPGTRGSLDDQNCP